MTHLLILMLHSFFRNFCSSFDILYNFDKNNQPSPQLVFSFFMLFFFLRLTCKYILEEYILRNLHWHLFLWFSFVIICLYLFVQFFDRCTAEHIIFGSVVVVVVSIMTCRTYNFWICWVLSSSSSCESVSSSFFSWSASSSCERFSSSYSSTTILPYFV